MDKKLQIFVQKFQIIGAGAGGGPAPMDDPNADGAEEELNVESDVGVPKLAKQQAPKNGLKISGRGKCVILVYP